MKYARLIPSDVLRSMLAMLSLMVAVSNAVAEEPLRLRVLSYNIHHAEGTDLKLDLERIAKVILSASPDIVALQEVDQKVTRSGSIDQPAELARLTMMNVAFGGNISLQGGHYGNAVLSRFRIASHKNNLLPNFDDGEQRGVLAVEIQIPNQVEPLLLLATHLDHRRDDKERIASAKAINQLVGKESVQRALFAGDLNDVVESTTLREFDSLWTRANSTPLPTIPVKTPDRQIDFVMYRPAEHWKVVEVKVLDESVASDHRPILAVLELLPQK